MAAELTAFRQVARESGRLWACTLALDRVLPFGALRLWPPRVVPAALLREQIELILRAWGLRDDHVETTVEKMLYADLRGIDSHGCSKLAFYERLRSEGRLNTTPAVEVVGDGAAALVDGGGGLGHVPATLAMEEAIRRCREHGVGVAAARNSGHFGAAGAYATMAADSGFIGVATTSTPTPAVVPTHGRTAMLGTNPIAVAVPAARNPPFLLDMATSTVSLGKLVEHWRSGRRLPRGWALDDRGRPLTRGRAATRHRRLTPLGGRPETSSYKGYGLALAVEILSRVVPGADAAGPAVGHFFMALDPASFRDPADLVADVDELIDSMRTAPPAQADRPVLVPGDPEQRVLAERSAGGIPLARHVLEDIRAVALASGAAFVLDGGRP